MKGGIITSAQGTQILTQKVAKLSDDAVLVVPGGRGTRPLVKDADFLAGLRDLADSAANVLSICTGSALLAAAGVLVNVKTTSNKYAFEWVTSTGDAVWSRKARWFMMAVFTRHREFQRELTWHWDSLPIITVWMLLKPMHKRPNIFGMKIQKLIRLLKILIMPSRKSRDFGHGMDRLTQRPFGHFFFWSALYF